MFIVCAYYYTVHFNLFQVVLLLFTPNVSSFINSLEIRLITALNIIFVLIMFYACFFIINGYVLV